MNRFTALIFTLAASGTLLAQEGKGREGGEGARSASRGAPLNFTQIDANGDGIVTKSEILAFFAKLDANKDGNLSRDELASASGGEAGEGAAPRKRGAEGARKGDGAKRTGEGEGGARKAGEGDGARKGSGEGDKEK